MHVRADFDDFMWGKGRYTLSPDRQWIVRDPDVQPDEYRPDGKTLEAVARGIHEEDGALALVQQWGFLTVAADDSRESVAACVMAAGKLLLHPVTDFPMPLPEPKLPSEWGQGMTQGRAISDELELPGGRVLKGAAKREHELRAAQAKARAEHERKMKANPPSAEWVKKREAEALADYFNVQAQFRVRATIDTTAGPAVLVLRPATLADWCWYRLAGTAACTVGQSQCKGCGKRFEVDLTDGHERRRQYCSPAGAPGSDQRKAYERCKQRHHYRLAKEAQEQTRNKGKTKRAGRAPGNQKRER